MSSAPTEPLAGTRAWRSLGARLALFYVAITLASSGAIIVLFTLRAGSLAKKEGQRDVEVSLEQYRLALEQGGVDGLRQRAASDARGGAYALRLTDEREVELFAVPDPAVGDAAGIRSVAESSSPREWSVAATRVSSGRRLELVMRNDVGQRVWRNAWEDAGVVLAIGLLAAIVGGFVISRRMLRPVGELAAATHAVLASGDLALRVPERGAADLDALAGLFNRMLARNEALIRAMRESLDNVAHDLRTPLTRLRTGAEVALRDAPDVERAREALADTLEESDRVLAMLTTLMDITGAETGAMRLDLRDLDLAELVRETVALYDHVATDVGVHLVTRLAPDVVVRGDRQRILQVAANLVDNAVKYTAAGGHIVLEVTREGAWGRLAVVDDGIGIAPEDLPHVWERLFRGDRSRSERGLGLGLSLVKAVVEAHHGEVTLRSEVGKGSTFEVRLPLALA